MRAGERRRLFSSPRDALLARRYRGARRFRWAMPGDVAMPFLLLAAKILRFYDEDD